MIAIFVVVTIIETGPGLFAYRAPYLCFGILPGQEIPFQKQKTLSLTVLSQ